MAERVTDLGEFRARRERAARHKKVDEHRYPKVTVEREDGSQRCYFEKAGRMMDRCSGTAAFYVSVPAENPHWVYAFLSCAMHLSRAVDSLCSRGEDREDAKHWGEHSRLATKALCETVIRVGRTTLDRLDGEEVRRPKRLGRNGPHDRYGIPGQPYTAEKECDPCALFAAARWDWKGHWYSKRSIAYARREMNLKPIWVNR